MKGPLGHAVRRLGQYALVLWAAVTLNFALPHLAPGDPVTYLYGGDAVDLSPEQLADIRSGYGLDASVPEQYLRFWADLAHGDLGTSVQHNRPVVDVLAEHLPWTLLLVGLGTLGAAAVGASLGAWAAWLRGERADRALVGGVLAVDAMPGFWIAMMLVAVFSVRLGWFPSYGGVPVDVSGWDGAREIGERLVLPTATLVLAMIGPFFLLTRAAMTVVLEEPFVRLARTKGIAERRVAVNHALRTALLPVYTNLTMALGAVISGAVVVETVFAYPGIGKLTYDAVVARDYPLLQGAFLIATVSIVAANLLADLTYPRIDPRVRHDRCAEPGPVSVEVAHR